MLEVQPILYRNEGNTVFLLDIPTSIAAAQSTCNPARLRLRSVAPLRQPYAPRNEPHASKRAEVERNTTDADLHLEYAVAATGALAEIQKHLQDQHWCLPRATVRADPAARRDEPDGALFLDRDSDPVGNIDDDRWVAVTSLLRDISVGRHPATYRIGNILASRSIQSPGEVDGAAGMNWQSFYVNSTDMMQMLSVHPDISSGSSALHRFLIPPGAAFLLGDCAEPAALRAAVRNSHDGDAQSRRFDFILLDPPWPNASAKRKCAYRRPLNLRGITDLIIGMDLDSHIAPGGFVGVWCTNKRAVRSLVLGPGGIFDSLNVGLVEEWIWIKTTVYGEPVSGMDSMWRKPYEIFLLGKAPSNPMAIAQHSEVVIRRVIAGVPDLHSRKPCLKSLVERLLVRTDTYRALEVFARNLVAGWWSWGDEVLKYNWIQNYVGL